MADEFRFGRKVPQKIRPAQETVILPTNRLPYFIPPALLSTLNLRKSLSEVYPCLLEAPTVENYLEKFHTLLFIEEHHVRTSGSLIARDVILRPTGDVVGQYTFEGYKKLHPRQNVVLECCTSKVVFDAVVVR